MNAPIYGAAEAPIRDAYRVYGQQARLQMRLDAYIERRMAELVRELTGSARQPAMRVEPGPWSPMTALRSVDVRTDMAFWVEETQDVHKVLWTLLACDPGTHKELCEQYALARAAREAVKECSE